ncbi:PEP-CTERM sorting domain-containing protein [Planctomycetales bacterium ZRK34]|nr:PEP-CTERM sorting domain-containing protein [Planctomycetales bacterium ZRK34]
MATGAAKADLLAAWNFNTGASTDSGAAWVGSINPSAGVQSGTALLDLSNILGPTEDFSGTTVNAVGSDASGSALVFQNGSSGAGNSQYFDLTFSMTGLSDLQLSFAAQRTSTGFNDIDISWSIDGSTFNAVDSNITFASSYAQEDFSVSSGVDNAANVTLRFAMDGGSLTSSSGNNRYDNIQLNASLAGSDPVNLTWDANTGTSGAQDGSGSWTTGGNNWYADSSNYNWSSATPSSATFGAGGAGGTVTVDGGGVTANNVAFDASATSEYTVTGGQVTLEGNITADKSATIASNLNLSDGTHSVSVADGQTLTVNTFSEANLGTGNLSITGPGKVSVTGDSTASLYLGAVQLSGGSTLEVQSGADTGYAFINSNNSSGVTYTGDGNISGGVNVFNNTIEGNLVVGTGFHDGDSTVSGTITPGYGSGAGTLEFKDDLRLYTTIYDWNLVSLADDNTGTAGTDWDLIKVGGELWTSYTSGGHTVNLSIDVDPTLADSFWNSDHSWLIVDVGSNGTTTDRNPVAFDNITTSLTGFSTSVDSNGDIYLNYDSNYVQPGPSGEIAITEFMANPGAGFDSQLEWVELYNYGTDTVNLNGWTIGDEDSDSFTFATDIEIAAGDFIILAVDKLAFEEAWLGSVDTDAVIEAAFALANSSDELLLKDENGNVIWQLAWSGGISSGMSVFLTDADFLANVYGTQDGDKINTGGTDDATGTLGYESNANTTDDNGYYSGLLGDATTPDYGSPLSLSSTSALVPEPSTFALMGLGLVGLARRRRR